MCGIVGARHDWLLRHGGDAAAAMRAAVAELAWRGPDGQAVARAGDWWLGCARLAITQPRSGQPLVRRGGRFVGVCNGAITNARELWARLLPGAERRAAPPNDAWLPLLAVERQDAQALHMLRGHHAYAVADAATGELVFGRDLFQEKPFFCLVERVAGGWQLVAFASTPVALQRLGMPRASSRRRLSEWFRFGWTGESVHRFSSRLLVTSLGSVGEPLASSTDRRGWHLRWGTMSRAQFAAVSRKRRPDVRQEVLASVARCTDTTVATALSLSGGLDSSCLAAALAANARRIPAYQLRTQSSSSRERDAAVAVAARTGLELRPVDAGVEILDALQHLTARAGQPLGDPSILAVHAVARAAAADGIRLLLSGEGADERFLGYRRYRALAWLPHVRWLRWAAPRWSMRYPARLLRALTAPDPITALLAVTPPGFADAVLAPDLAQRRCWRDDRQWTGPWRDRLAIAQQRDILGYLPCDLLPKVDVACMAAGVEARAPFLEGDASSDAARRNLGKRELREAFAAELPPEVLRLPKTGFALPLDRWFRGDLPWLDLLAEPRTQQRPHLRPGGVARAVDLHRRGKADLGHGLYLLVAAELHLRALDRGITDSVRTEAPGAT